MCKLNKYQQFLGVVHLKYSFRESLHD